MYPLFPTNHPQETRNDRRFFPPPAQRLFAYQARTLNRPMKDAISSPATSVNTSPHFIKKRSPFVQFDPRRKLIESMTPNWTMTAMAVMRKTCPPSSTKADRASDIPASIRKYKRGLRCLRALLIGAPTGAR